MRIRVFVALSLIAASSAHANTDDPLDCVKTVYTRLSEKTTQPSAWIEGSSGVACKGGNTGERAWNCIDGLMASDGVYPDESILATFACSGGSTASEAKDCVEGLQKDGPLKDQRSATAIACSGRNTAAQAQACVKGILGHKLLVNVEKNMRLEMAAKICAGGSDPSKAGECLDEIQPFIKTESDHEITEQKKTDPNASADEMGPLRILSLSAEVCSSGNTADQAKGCIKAGVESMRRNYGDKFPIVFAPGACAFGQTSEIISNCTEEILKKVVIAEAKRKHFDLTGGSNQLIYVERHCTGNMLSRVLASVKNPTTPEQPKNTDEYRASPSDVGTPSQDASQPNPNAAKINTIFIK